MITTETLREKCARFIRQEKSLPDMLHGRDGNIMAELISYKKETIRNLIKVAVFSE